MDSKIPELMWAFGIIVCLYLILLTSENYYDRYIGFAGLIYLLKQ